MLNFQDAPICKIMPHSTKHCCISDEQFFYSVAGFTRQPATLPFCHETSPIKEFCQSLVINKKIKGWWEGKNDLFTVNGSLAIVVRQIQIEH